MSSWFENGIPALSVSGACRSLRILEGIYLDTRECKSKLNDILSHNFNFICDAFPSSPDSPDSGEGGWHDARHPYRPQRPQRPRSPPPLRLQTDPSSDGRGKAVPTRQ